METDYHHHVGFLVKQNKKKGEFLSFVAFYFPWPFIYSNNKLMVLIML